MITSETNVIGVVTSDSINRLEWTNRIPSPLEMFIAIYSEGVNMAIYCKPIKLEVGTRNHRTSFEVLATIILQQSRRNIAGP